MRAALVHLDNWVTHNEQPPDNGYPSHADNTIIEAGALAELFRTLPGVEFPEHHKVMRRLDFGPDRAVPTVIPPGVGDAYPSLVSAVDVDGNEVGGIRLPARRGAPGHVHGLERAPCRHWRTGASAISGRNRGGRSDSFCGDSRGTYGVR